jgi:hypothetical protein
MTTKPASIRSPIGRARKQLTDVLCIWINSSMGRDDGSRITGELGNKAAAAWSMGSGSLVANTTGANLHADNPLRASEPTPPKATVGGGKRIPNRSGLR